MHLFSKNKKVKARLWEELPKPKPNELFATPIDNRLWHPKLAVRESRIKFPQWYKDIPSGHAQLKSCYGLADLIKTGYVLPMWATLDVKRPLSKLDERWDAQYLIRDSYLFEAETISQKDMEYFFTQNSLTRNQFPNFQTGTECPVAQTKPRESSYLKLVNPWCFRTAPGWSSLFLAMLWEPNKHYQLLSAVIHTDYYPNANMVFNILSNDAFRIEEGTSICHIIPFERSQSMLNTSLIKGDESTHKFLKDTGFGSVFTTDADFHGGYKKEQKRMDKEVNRNG